MQPDVLIYTKDLCGYCVRAKDLLEQKQWSYREINVSKQPDKREEMLERSDGARTLPQIFINGIHVGGCDELYELEREGELDTMVEQSTNDGTPEPDPRDVIVLGSGCAGLTAALYTARANLNPLVLKGNEPGGQLTLTTDVENFPGFPEGIQGPELMQRMEEQAARFDADFVSESAVGVDLSQRPFTVETPESTYRARALIVATGASAKWLGLESEKKYTGSGVSSCATCDGFFFKDQEVLVIGGGDTAMEEALFLTKFASRVRVLHRRDELRASEIMARRAKQNDKIEFLWNTELIEVMGEDEQVTGARIVQHPDGHPKEKWENGNPQVIEKTLDCRGIFLGIGHKPNTEFLEGELAMDEEGYLQTDEQVLTSVEGVFAAGDVFDKRYRQAVTAAGTGCQAAMEVEEYLQQQKMKKKQPEAPGEKTPETSRA